MKLKKVLGCLRRADELHGLIADGDHIAVGVSGGKDSLTLLYCLALYRSFSKKQYTLLGIYIDAGFGSQGFEAIEQFFAQMEVPVIRIETRIVHHLSEHLVHEAYDCSLCSRLKKGTLIRVAKEHGCNKLALGHHADDAVETVLMNAVYGAKLATIPFSRYLSREAITMIRPLLYAYEEDILRVAGELSFPVMKSGCPRDHHSKREEMKRLLQKLYEQYPQAKINFIKMLENNEQLELW